MQLRCHEDVLKTVTVSANLVSTSSTPPAAFPYRFGYASLRSTAALPTLRPGKGEPADVSIFMHAVVEPESDAPSEGVEWLHHWRQDNSHVTLSLARSGDGFLLRAPTLCDFDLQPTPGRIGVMPLCEIEAATLEHLLVDQVLPRYFSLAGRLYLHASAIAIDGQCALFLGKSGWGKSTLAALLQRAGHEVLSDDCVEIAFTAKQALASPTYPSLRMLPDTVESLYPDGVTTLPMAHYSPKLRVAMDPTTTGEETPIRGIYLLGDPDEPAESPTIEAAPPTEACLALIRHAFQLDLGNRDLSAGLLQKCSDLARQGSVWHLRYPRRFDAAPEIVAAVQDHFRAITPPPNAR